MWARPEAMPLNPPATPQQELGVFLSITGTHSRTLHNINEMVYVRQDLFAPFPRPNLMTNVFATVTWEA